MKSFANLSKTHFCAIRFFFFQRFFKVVHDFQPFYNTFSSVMHHSVISRKESLKRSCTMQGNLVVANLLCFLDSFSQKSRKAFCWFFEEVDLAAGGGAVWGEEFAFAVAAAGGLGEGVEAGEGAEDGGEVEVDTGFDEGGGDDIGGGVGLEAFADLGDDVAAVGGAHPGAEVEGVAGLEGVEGGVEVAGVLAGVDDAEGALFLGDAVGEIGPLHAAEEVVVDAAECGVEAVDVGGELGGAGEAEGGEVGLGGGAEDDGAAVVGDEAAEELGAGGEELFGEFLGFVEDDDAVDDVVEFAAAGGLCGKEGFEELDVGGDDNGDSVPVLGELTERVGDFVFVFAPFGLGVVLEDVVCAEYIGEGLGGLLNDGGIRDGVDDLLFVVGNGMLEGEAEGGEGLAAAGGNGEGVEAGGVFGLVEDGMENVCAEFVDGGVGLESSHARTVAIEEDWEIVEGLGGGAGGSAFGVHETLGVEPVGIDQARIKHLDPEPELMGHFFTVAVFNEIGQKILHIFGRLFLDTLRFLRIAKVRG